MKTPARLLPWHEGLWKRLQDRRRGGTLPHALLLTGPAGLGKEQFAFQFAWSFLCEHPRRNGLPCGECKGCSLVSASSHPDFLWVTRPPASKEGTVADLDKRTIRVNHNAEPPERSGKQILVDQTRALIETLDLTSLMGGGKVVVITPADRMNRNAANALLKTLEEPSAGTLLMLVATEPGRLPATVRSRCQRIAFTPPTPALAEPWLEQALPRTSPERRVELLALAGGGPLRAVTLHDSGALERRQNARLQFAELLEGHQDPVAVGRDWARDPGPAEALNWLRYWSQNLIRVRMAGEKDMPGTGPLHEAAQRVDLKWLFERVADIEAARNLTETNVNPGLMLIDLLSAWVPAKGTGAVAT